MVGNGVCAAAVMSIALRLLLRPDAVADAGIR